MSESTENIVTTYLKASWNSGLYTLARNFLAPGFQYRTTFSKTPLNLDQYVDFIRAFRKAMPDLEIHIEDIMSKDNRVTTYKTFLGVVEEPFYGIPASDKVITFPVVSFWEVRDGKIAVLNTLMDINGIERQLKARIYPEKPLSERRV